MMVSDFGEGWVSSPIEKWTAILLKSGVLFWLGGVLARCYHIEIWQDDLSVLFQSCGDYLKPVPALLGIFTAMLLIAAFANLVRQFDLTMLRFLEGYYPYPGFFWKWRKNRFEKRFQKKTEQWKKLNRLKRQSATTPGQDREFARLDGELMYVPKTKELRLPTRLGNFLRETEDRPRQKYGLDTFVCWPRLWLLLPDEVRREITEARGELDTMVRVFTWSLLFMVWTLWAWWAAPVSLVGAWLAHRRIFQKAEIYGQLAESAFDLYRRFLYEAMGRDMPGDPVLEKAEGEKLSIYLWRGQLKS